MVLNSEQATFILGVSNQFLSPKTSIFGSMRML